jgi:tetratricopeptide (TPR) repeat protein
LVLLVIGIYTNTLSSPFIFDDEPHIVSNLHIRIFKLTLGSLAKAVEHLTQALKLDPQFAPAHNNLGVALQRLGKFKEAQTHFARALQIDPGYSAARKSYQENLNHLKSLDR